MFGKTLNGAEILYHGTYLYKIAFTHGSFKVHQFHIEFHVSRFGVRIPVKATFSLFFLLPTFCNGQSNGEYFLNNFIDWLIWVAIGVTSQKIALTRIRTPNLETRNSMWNWNCHGMVSSSKYLENENLIKKCDE